MQDYKIRIPNADMSRQVQEKAFDLGYHWNFETIGSRTVFTAIGIEWIVLFHNATIQWRRNSQIKFESTASIPEISYQNFLRLGEPTINNTTTEEIMSEITLKCIQEPRSAKNITVDRDYTGILTDSEDTQVDTLREAKFFRCVNNNGVEAKYRLSLFAPITPPVPPRPAKITQEELIERLVIRASKVVCSYNNEEHRIIDFGYGDLVSDDVNCSCGIKSVNEINDLYENIAEYDELDEVESIVSDYDAPDFINALFKKIVLARVASLSVAMCLFSTTSGESSVCMLMDELSQDVGGVASDFFMNPNSHNNIKAWLIPKS